MQPRSQNLDSLTPSKPTQFFKEKIRKILFGVMRLVFTAVESHVIST